jgi:hypothetical protein
MGGWYIISTYSMELRIPVMGYGIWMGVLDSDWLQLPYIGYMFCA